MNLRISGNWSSFVRKAFSGKWCASENAAEPYRRNILALTFQKVVSFHLIGLLVLGGRRLDAKRHYIMSSEPRHGKVLGELVMAAQRCADQGQPDPNGHAGAA